MNFNQNVLIALAMMAASSSAFAPPQSTQRAIVMPKQTPNVQSIIQSDSALFMSGKTDNQLREQLEELQEKANEATKFLVVDTKSIQDELANNWGWIVASGVLTSLLGVAAFGAPLLATSVAYDATVLAIAVTAVVNLINVFKAQTSEKLKYGLSVPLYGFLAYYMSTHPAQGLNFITLTIAAVIAAEGIFETAVAAKNKGIEGRPWLFVSGIGSVLASVWLSSTIPASSLFAPGAALGTRLTSSGARKVATGLLGKELADQRAK
jgi:uncharacterized membrane protein HdeD (DUF308 family)